MTTTITDPLAAGRGQDATRWLTTILRPAGTLDAAALAQLAAALVTPAASSDMVVIDLTAASVPDPGALAATVRVPARRLAQPGRCLLLVGAAPDLVVELEHADIPAAAIGQAGRGPLPPIS
jgi:hypothetical protein